jgi:hypothetical protein
MTIETATHEPAATAHTPAKMRLGEELPVFCEKCGYSLHGLPHTRCEHCSVLQFHCPECGHHQPINTLRPAFQRVLGRMRAWYLWVSVLFRINWFGWLLLAWLIAGYENSFSYNWTSQARGAQFIAPRVDDEAIFGFSICGGLFGLVSRMWLLRWRNSVVVGVVLAAVVAGAMLGGAIWAMKDRDLGFLPWNSGFTYYMLIAAVGVFAGVVAAWPFWAAAVRIFLPRRTGDALLDWQRSLSESRVSDLARQ